MHAEIEGVVRGLETAWNQGNGGAFARYFDEDADFVNIYGTYGKGRQKIAEANEMIFRTVYAGSVVRYAVSQARFLADGIAVVHIDAQLDAPHGPLAGRHHAIPSMVMHRGADGWSIAAFQNTLVQPPPGMRP